MKHPNHDDVEIIPFNRPFVVGKELFYISQAVVGGHLAGDGRFTKLSHEWIEERLGARKVLLTPSCTAALELAAMLADIEPGDEIILPSFTFVSTVNAFMLRGATPRFVDIRQDTLNIDEQRIEEAVSEKTRVIVPVHYAGVGCDMNAIAEIAARRELMVIEDAAQGFGATYDDRYLGLLGDLGTFSFHETKNLICGEGGALVVNDERLIERAEVLREKGTDRSKFFRGEVDKYTWVDLGSSYLPSELNAAYLYAQLEHMDLIAEKRGKIWDYYMEGLTPLQEKGALRLPVCPDDCRHNGHMFYVITPDQRHRDELIRFMKERKIHLVFHYVPLHTSPMGQVLGYRVGDLPLTEDIASRLVRLPCYYELTPPDQDRVISGIHDFFGSC